MPPPSQHGRRPSTGSTHGSETSSGARPTPRSPLAVWLLLLGPWARGAEVVLHQGPFDVEERLDLIRRFEVTILCQSPAEYSALADAGEKVLTRYVPSRLRRMVSTGDFLSSDVVSAFEQAWGLPIEDGWGQTECGIVIGHGADDGLEGGSVGQPLPGHEIAIVDESGAELPAGSEGQLALRGRPPTLFTGYWDARRRDEGRLPRRPVPDGRPRLPRGGRLRPPPRSRDRT